MNIVKKSLLVGAFPVAFITFELHKPIVWVLEKLTQWMPYDNADMMSLFLLTFGGSLAIEVGSILLGRFQTTE
jgi:hypothetical protein